tara:strand:+ start:303 stop:737 length:435 start_codon:yes stop_codon:yes gene_type:complete
MENIKKIIERHMPSKAELLSFKYNQRSSFIKIVIDSIEEISVDDTAILARDIKNDDYILSNFPDGVRLEVGTPGIGSPLERIFQYEKNIGRNIELEYHHGSEIIRKTYTLKSVEKNGIVVEKNNKKNDVFFNDIKSAKIKVSFD